jgi:hypothetical protein
MTMTHIPEGYTDATMVDARLRRLIGEERRRLFRKGRRARIAAKQAFLAGS